MEYSNFIGPGIAGVALVVALLSFLSARNARLHTRIVEYEQRRQEVRQILHEGKLIVAESTQQWNRAIFLAEDILVVEKISEQLKRTILEGTKMLRDANARNDNTRVEYENVLEQLDELSPTPSTQERIDLEQLVGTAIHLKNEVQASYNKINGAVQGLEDTITEIRRGRSIRKS